MGKGQENLDHSACGPRAGNRRHSSQVGGARVRNTIEKVKGCRDDRGLLVAAVFGNEAACFGERKIAERFFAAWPDELVYRESSPCRGLSLESGTLGKNRALRLGMTVDCFLATLLASAAG